MVNALDSHLIYKLALCYPCVMVFAFSWATTVRSGTGFVLAISLGSYLLIEKTEVTYGKERNKSLQQEEIWRLEIVKDNSFDYVFAFTLKLYKMELLMWVSSYYLISYFGIALFLKRSNFRIFTSLAN